MPKQPPKIMIQVSDEQFSCIVSNLSKIAGGPVPVVDANGEVTYVSQVKRKKNHRNRNDHILD